MCPDKKRPAENTCRIVKGLDAVWAHFCPSKPCLPLSIDGNPAGYNYAVLDAASCIGCGTCYTVCPDYVYTMVEE